VSVEHDATAIFHEMSHGLSHVALYILAFLVEYN
jgi:hypothetical protein